MNTRSPPAAVECYLQFAPYPKLLIDREDADYTLAPALALVHDLLFSSFRRYGTVTANYKTHTLQANLLLKSHCKAFSAKCLPVECL